MLRVNDDLLISGSAAFNNASFRNSNFLNKRSTSPVKSRRKHSHIFQLCYTELCSMYNTPMIFCIKAHLHKRMLDFNGDRVKLDEWRPILRALSLDRSLHLIAIRSKTSCTKVLEHFDSETKSRTISKLPVLVTNFVFRRLITSLSSCLTNNSHLKCLELDGLLLSGDYLESLITGLEKNTSLQHLSLHRCPLGDTGCQLVCSSLRNLPNILTLDLSGCNITEKGAYAIAKTLQNLNRYGENWKQSLRYRTPDTNIMPGLRRVTLNHNPLIGDHGVSHIVNVLRDDLWLKALDLQNVGLTQMGGTALLDLLHENKILSIVDVHNNPELDESLFESIMSLLAANNFGKHSEYHWIQEETLYMPRKPSYHCRDPLLFARKPQRAKDLSTCQLNPSRNESNVRLTKSSTIPASRKAFFEVIKAHSTSTIVGLHAKSVDLRTHGKPLPGHPFQWKQLTAPTTVCPNKFDHISGDGDSSESVMRAKLRELASLLEEETQKRLDAEKQKADLELQLKSLTQEQEGQILMDVNVVKEITEAFDAFNSFVALFARGGPNQPKAENYERICSPNHLVKCAEQESSQTNFQDNAITKEEEENPAILSCSSIIDKEQKEDSNDGQLMSGGSSAQSLIIEIDVQSESSLEWKSDEHMRPIIATETPKPTARKSPLCHVQKVLNEIIKDTAPADPLSRASLANENDDFASRNLTSDNDQENVSNRRSSESLYINADQLLHFEDSNSSWTTETDWSSDNSPTCTLTELNACV